MRLSQAHFRIAAALIALASPVLQAARCDAPPQPGSPVESRTPSQPASYAFATELGSGVYEFCGRQMQIYRLPFSIGLREAAPALDAGVRPGLRITLPVTVGFLDFSPRDVISGGLPDRVDSFSFVPGLVLEIRVHEHWRLEPYARAGGSVAGGTPDSWLYGAGLRSELLWSDGPWAGRLVNDLGYVGVSFAGDLPGDDFARLRNGVELRRGTGWRRRSQELDFAPYAVLDVLADRPRPPVARAEAARVQLELGLSLGTRPGIRLRGIPLPRIGAGYRFAGDLTGWRIVLGAPF